MAVLRRLLLALAVWLGVATLTFGLMYLIPADPAQTLAGAQADPETVAAIRTQLGLDDPLGAQYLRYLGNALRGDFGHSYVTGEPVLPTLLARFPATLQLAVGALVVYLLLGVGFGVVGGVKPRSLGDRMGRLVAVGGVSVPTFWLGLVLLYLFAYKAPILPLGGYGSPLHLILPALTLGVGGAAYYARLLRTTLLEAMGSDYVRTARAKGLPEGRIVARHAMPNAALPALTLFGLDFAHLLGGAVLTESIFAWPGIGSNAMQAIANLDVPTIMGTVLFSATVIVLFNLVIDLAYGFADPRLKGV
ncbi:ABC transporter permease [bacterium]|nr:ABC transporter permease [bacterium]